MGWARGSEHAEKLINVLIENIPDAEVRKIIYIDMIDAWYESDWDTQDEVLGIDPVFDAALKEVDPDFFDEEE